MKFTLHYYPLCTVFVSHTSEQVSLLVPGNYQGERTIKQNHVFDRAGVHRIKLPTVGVRTSGMVVVEMVDKNGLYFSDDFALIFHMHNYKFLSYFWYRIIVENFANTAGQTSEMWYLSQVRNRCNIMEPRPNQSVREVTWTMPEIHLTVEKQDKGFEAYLQM